MKTDHNRIPRSFLRIKVEMLIDTNLDKVGDVLHVFKNDCGSGYLALNKRTGKYAYMFPSMLRDKEVCKVLEVMV